MDDEQKEPVEPQQEQGDTPRDVPIAELLRRANESAIDPAPGAPSGSGAPSAPDEEAAQKILEEMGVNDDTILTDGAAHHETVTEWQCRVCRAYNLATVKRPDGTQFIAPVTSLRCWNCGSAKWMTVEGGYHAPNILDKIGPPAPARYVEPDSEMAIALNEAQTLLDEAQLFPSDAEHQDNEPNWPHDLAVAIVGSALYLGRKRSEPGIAGMGDLITPTTE